MQYKCSKCKEVKPTTDFYPDKNRCTGVMSRCKSCDKAKSIEYNKSGKRKEKRQRDPFTSLLQTLQSRAKKHKRECSITVKDLKNLWIKQNGICASMLKIPMVLNVDSGDFRQVSVDRIDSTKAYTLDNVQLMTVVGNCMYKHYNKELVNEAIRNAWNII
jgi:hypothetical protein